MSTDESGLSLFDETASAAGNFPTALRGYDRSAVDEYVRSLESAVNTARVRANDMQSQVNDLQSQVNDLHQRSDEAAARTAAEDVDYTNLGGRAADILRLAEEQARAVIDEAHQESEKVKESGRRDADAARQVADRAGADIKTSGLAEIRALRAQDEQDARAEVEKATAEAAAIVAAARREAESLRRVADHEAQTARQTAYLDTETLRRQVEKESADIRAQVADEREQAIGQLRAEHDEAVTATAALLEEATRHNAESTQRFETDVAEAARIRAEAMAAAEKVKLDAVREAEERVTVSTKQAAAINERTQQEFSWRKQQLKRETDLLSARKQAVLHQLASLSALAEQTANNFPELEDLEGFESDSGDRTVLRPPGLAPSMPSESEAEQSEQDSAPAEENVPAGENSAGEISAVENSDGHVSGEETSVDDAEEDDYDPDATILIPAGSVQSAGTTHLAAEDSAAEGQVADGDPDDTRR